MADDNSKNPFMDMFQDFGKSMSIPGPDINDMMDYHRKNLQALQAAVQVSTGSAQSLSQFGDVCRADFAAAADDGSARFDPSHRVISIRGRTEISALAHTLNGAPQCEVCTGIRETVRPAAEGQAGRLQIGNRLGNGLWPRAVDGNSSCTGFLGGLRGFFDCFARAQQRTIGIHRRHSAPHGNARLRTRPHRSANFTDTAQRLANHDVHMLRLQRNNLPICGKTGSFVRRVFRMIGTKERGQTSADLHVGAISATGIACGFHKFDSLGL